MKVIHLTSGSLNSGAAKGALRLHQGLLDIGVDSTIVGDNSENLNVNNLIDVRGIKYKIKRALNYKYNKIMLRLFDYKDNAIFSIGNDIFNVYSKIDFSQYDVINIHWVNYSLSLKSIEDIAKSNKVVWTMRDMWPFTGGCHYSLDCLGYTNQCTSCPILRGSVTNKIALKKKRVIEKLKIISISEWLKNEFKKAMPDSSDGIDVIYNSFDEDEFKQLNNVDELRKKYNLNKNKKYCLIGAQNINDPYKGKDRIKEIIIKYKEDFTFLFFGNGCSELVSEMQNIIFEYVDFGFCNESKLCELFNISDVFLMLSTQEAFGKTVIESLACGTPVLVCRGGAPEEIVRNVCNRVYFFERDNLQEVVKSSVNTFKVREVYSNQSIAKKYLTLYESVLGAS